VRIDDGDAVRLWSSNLVLYTAALTVAGEYVPFTDIGAAVVKMSADGRGITIKDVDKQELTEIFTTIPPQLEVPAAPRKPRGTGFRLFALTDNVLEIQSRQLEYAGIVDPFERRFSGNGVNRQKPGPETYTRRRAAGAYPEAGGTKSSARQQSISLSIPKFAANVGGSKCSWIRRLHFA
jgi:2-haloacid dehalogenase